MDEKNEPTEKAGTNEPVNKKVEENTISAEELANIEKDVLSKEQKKNAGIIKETEDRVKKELLKEQQFSKLKEDKEKLEEAVKAQIQEKQKLKKEMEEKLEESKKNQGGSKAIVNNKNPFSEKNPQLTDEEILKKAAEMTSEQIMDIDEKSKEAFLKDKGLSPSQWV